MICCGQTPIYIRVSGNEAKEQYNVFLIENLLKTFSLQVNKSILEQIINIVKN